MAIDNNFYPPNESFKRAVEESMDEILPEKILDLVWNDYLYYHSFFESLDGWSLTDSSGGGSGVTGAGVTLETGATSGNQSTMLKSPDHASILSFDKSSRFRSGFEILTASTSNIEFAITFGESINSLTDNHYGFRLDAGVLKGVCADGSAISEVDLLTITAQTRYLIEARYLPNDKVIFYVSDGAISNELIERGVLTTNLPTGNVGVTDNAWFRFYIETLENAAKQLYFSFLEYTQKR